MDAVIANESQIKTAIKVLEKNEELLRDEYLYLIQNRKSCYEYLFEKDGIVADDVESIAFDENYINTVLNGMRGVTEDIDGTAYGAFRDLEMEVGGKTGSAEAGAYTNGWFVGLIETADNTYFFATNIGAGSDATGSTATDITMSILSDMNIWD